nr:NADH dehydrogenase subunit 2 [Penthicodes variegata]
MKMNISKKMFMTIIILSLMMAMSSNNVLFTWMAMEVNLISFIPLMKKSNKMNEQSMKYLITQSIASSVMVMALIINSIINNPVNDSVMMMTGILMKMGMMPFHLWLPGVMQMLTWTMCMMMVTLQKIIPTIFATQMTNLSLLMTPMLISMLMSPITATKQSSMKKILAYSSITNSPMMIIAMKISKQQFTLFFIMYSTINLMMLNILKKNGINFINQINSQKNMTKLSLLISSLSMSGMPPTTGFLMKWMLIKSSMNFSMTIPILMITSSLISSFLYLNMILPTMTNSIKSKKMNKLNKPNLSISIMMNIMGIPMMMLTNLN